MKRQSIAEALRDAIAEEMERDETIFCIGEDIAVPGGWGGAFTVTLGLEKKFPDRMINTPIAELGLFGVAVGRHPEIRQPLRCSALGHRHSGPGITGKIFLCSTKLRDEALVDEALGGKPPPDLRRAYAVLLGLSSHDLSAMPIWRGSCGNPNLKQNLLSQT